MPVLMVRFNYGKKIGPKKRGHWKWDIELSSAVEQLRWDKFRQRTNVKTEEEGESFPLVLFTSFISRGNWTKPKATIGGRWSIPHDESVAQNGRRKTNYCWTSFKEFPSKLSNLILSLKLIVKFWKGGKNLGNVNAGSLWLRKVSVLHKQGICR